MTADIRRRGARLLAGAVLLVLAGCGSVGVAASPSPEASATAAATPVDQPGGSHAPIPSPDASPPDSEEARLLQQADDALARWADVANGAAPDAIVFVHGLTDGGGWRGPGAGGRKSSFLSGVIEATTDLPSEVPPPAEVVWPDGSRQTVPLLSAADAFDQMARGAESSACDDCRPLEVVGAKLVNAQTWTSRGRARVPAWQFEFTPADKPLSPITHVAVRDRIEVKPSEEWDPDGDNPIGTSIDAAFGTPEDARLTVTFVGSPHRGDRPCGADYTAEAIESEQAVVVIVRAESRLPPDTPSGPCLAVGAMRTAVVDLASPIAHRTVLEVQFGTPVALLAKEPPADVVRD